MSEEPIRILASRAAIPIIKRELSRRNFLAFTAAAASAATLAACTPAGTKPGAGPVASGGPLEPTLNIYSWGTTTAQKWCKTSPTRSARR